MGKGVELFREAVPGRLILDALENNAKNFLHGVGFAIDREMKVWGQNHLDDPEQCFILSYGDDEFSVEKEFHTLSVIPFNWKEGKTPADPSYQWMRNAEAFLQRLVWDIYTFPEDRSLVNLTGCIPGCILKKAIENIFDESSIKRSVDAPGSPAHKVGFFERYSKDSFILLAQSHLSPTRVIFDDLLYSRITLVLYNWESDTIQETGNRGETHLVALLDEILKLDREKA